MNNLKAGLATLDKWDVTVDRMGLRYCYFDGHMMRGYWLTLKDIKSAADYADQQDGFSRWCSSTSVREMSERATKRMWG